jgi:PAB-dependent poly(A)-specific ribonuclease subunit 2
MLTVLAVPEAEGRNDLVSPWFVFNDFVVRNISEDEALSFPNKWKVCEPVNPVIKAI